ncbi:Protein transport protein Sec31A [Schistosoma haematobium]|uniref:Protein transport protein Sec31A n=1 Tax=Schistosoma haematobium TaxID=6185 RepID=A0A922LE16_SCHHA|nr:Protein transport protein Sec31A [Schistosoma haematobium]KAH9580289.1 Protein transport protein Sec31A [Schistosoma haematobium]
MKVKELEKFAHSAWSPLSCNRTYLATVTAENDREATDSNINTSMTSPTLDIYEFNVKENNLSMQMNISLQIKQKATSLLWTAPINNDHLDIGLLIIGSMSGSLYLYDSQKLISMSQNRTSSQITTNTIHKPYHINTIDTIIENNENDNSIMSSCQQLSSIYITENNMSNYLYTSRENIHNNVVRSLDFNRFQTNLFASASNDEEIFIWDVGKMEHPMSPGSKIQPLENVNQVAWNPRVQHILCSTSIGRCVIWDLRKSGPVLQLTKTMCQLEPQMMAWSPDVATRLCIADPNNPNANVQLWDLRYPKHMLCLLSHWPPLLSSNLKTTNPLNNYALGNAGTVNSLCWGIPECQKSMNKSNFYDKDMIVMTIGASGALPTLNGNYGTKLNPTYAEMLVVWSVNQALNSTPDNVTCQEAIPEPIFIGRLEGLDDQELVNPLLCFNTLPTNASIQWIPNHPNLICVTQSDGWITVYNLLSGINKQIEQINIERYNKQCILARNSLNLRNSHKVAEVFHNEQLLMDYNNTDNTDNNNNNNDNLQSDSLYPVFMNDPNVNSIDKEQINSGSDQLLLDNPNSMDSVNLSLLQPMPLLRVAPCWLKRPCGVHFAFGGRLVTFSSLTNLQSKRTRTNSSMSNSKRTDPNSRSSDIGSIEQNSTVGTVPDQNHLNSTEVQSYYVFIKCIDAFQLEPSSSPTVQLHSSVNSNTNGSDDQWKNSIQDIIECLISVLDCPNDYLSTVCENAKALFKPMLSSNNNNPALTNDQGHLDLWNVIQARLDKSTPVKSSLSNLLGYSKQDFQGFNESTPSQLLNALKYALVTNDIQTIIQLCLHPKFSSLSLPNLSTLSIFAIMLTDLHRSKQIELYEDVKLKLYQSLNEISLNNHIIHDPILNSIIMLFNCVLLHTNWLNIIENWPLSDWKTILTALINHLWDQDIELLRKLCSIFAKRLLDNTTNDNNNTNITSFESGLAACICCIIGDDLDHLTECWLRLNNINENHSDDVIKCLPLALLLLFLFRLSSSTGINHCTNKSSQLLIHLAIWLIETRFDHHHNNNDNNGSNEQISLLALNLLTKTLSIVELYSQTMNNLIDLRHRIWCNLSMEQQQQQKQQILSNELSQQFLCPYPHIQCHCGLSKANSSTEIQSSLFIKTTNTNHYQPQQPVNYPSLSNQTMQCTYQSKINQNQFYEQKNLDSFNYPTFSSSSTNCLSFNDSVVGVQTSISGQNKSTFNFSPPISSHNADVLPSLTSPVPSTIISSSSSSSSNIYSPLGLPPVNSINQSNLSSARQFPPVVAPPLLDANYNNNNNNRNYPVMNHHYVQPPNNNLLGTDSVSGNSMSNVLKPPLPATPASPTQSAQMSTTFGHNFGGTMPPSFQSLNKVPYGMLTPIPQFNTQQQQEHIQQHMPPLLPAPMSIPPPPPPTQTQHQSSVISPGWNDPPILTTDKPRQTTVSHNPYYNPMEFISSPLPQPNNSVSPSNFPQPMMELHTTPSNPPLPPGCPATGLNVYQPAPPPIQNSISPINAGIIHPQQQLQQPLPLSSTHTQQQSLSSSFMGPPVQQPSYPQVQGVYHQQEQYPNYFQPPIEQNSQFCTISSTLPPMSSVVPPNSYTELNLWPAAQPLSTTVKSGITSQTIIENAMPSNSFTSSNDDHTDLQLSHKLDSISLNSDHNNVNDYSLPTEFQPIKKVLFDLIENCRKVGDKQTHHKLMNVEYCLNQFYNNISTGQLQLDHNSMEYLQFCISSIQSNDYVNALKQINLFIQSAIELSDIQYYGPALKRLIQTAKQLSINMNNINH